jgi:hypothetical protein
MVLVRGEEIGVLGHISFGVGDRGLGVLTPP